MEKNYEFCEISLSIGLERSREIENSTREGGKKGVQLGFVVRIRLYTTGLESGKTKRKRKEREKRGNRKKTKQWDFSLFSIQKYSFQIFQN